MEINVYYNHNDNTVSCVSHYLRPAFYENRRGVYFTMQLVVEFN